MQHVLSTHLFVNHRLTVAQLDKVQHAGIDAVEIFCARQHLDYRDGAQITELGHWFRDSGLKLHSLHAPMYTDEMWGRSGPQSVISITEPVKGKRINPLTASQRLMTRSAACGKFGTPTIATGFAANRRTTSCATSTFP